MPSKINYDKYLKSINLKEINNAQQNVIKNYLEEQCEHDEALKAVYNPEKIDACYSFIFECVRKVANGNSSVLEDAVVFKMARDYFIEILPTLKDEPEKKPAEEKKEEAPAVDVTPVQETVKEVSEQIEADATSDNVKRDEYGFEIYGEESDEPEASAEEEPCHQEEEKVIEENVEPVKKSVAEIETAFKQSEGQQGFLFEF